MHLGKRLRHARERRGFTQEQLAQSASTGEQPISQAAISALEKRDSETSVFLFAFARALKINPEWLQTGVGDSGLEADAWKPMPQLAQDEAELIIGYRQATNDWKVTLRYLSKLRADAQGQASQTMNIVLAKIAAEPVPDSRLGNNWTRPDKKEDQ